jgi:NADH-ubiquinone oxidoreductase chain 5
LTAVFTGIYSSDVLDDVFAEEATTSRETALSVHASTFIETFVLGFLAILSVLSGYLCRDLFVGLGSDFFGNSLAVLQQNAVTSAEFLPLTIKLLPTFLSLLVSFEVDRREDQIFEMKQTLHFLSHK